MSSLAPNVGVSARMSDWQVYTYLVPVEGAPDKPERFEIEVAGSRSTRPSRGRTGNPSRSRLCWRVSADRRARPGESATGQPLMRRATMPDLWLSMAFHVLRVAAVICIAAGLVGLTHLSI